MNLRFQMCPATHLVSCYIGKELMDYFGLFGLLDYYRRFFVLSLGFTFLPTLSYGVYRDFISSIICAFSEQAHASETDRK